MTRILMHHDNTAQTWHRGFLPVKNLAPALAQEGIVLESSDKISLDYDAYVFHRKPSPSLMSMIARLKDAGKKIILELDDDAWHIPSWSPAYEYYKDHSQIDWLRDIADEVWVSTETLRKVVGRGIVLPNLIDVSYWPKVYRPKNEQLRLIWAGSAYHDPDIELVASVYERLLAQYPNILCLFFGSYPTSMSEWVRIPGSNSATLVPHPRYGGRLGYVPPVAIERYPETLVNINADIGIAALVDEPFAHSKSNIKVIEYSMTGAASVATDLPPYHDSPAFIGDLYDCCSALIEKDQLRVKLGQLAQQEVMDEWTWSCSKKDLWLEAIRSIT